MESRIRTHSPTACVCVCVCGSKMIPGVRSSVAQHSGSTYYSHSQRATTLSINHGQRRRSSRGPDEMVGCCRGNRTTWPDIKYSIAVGSRHSGASRCRERCVSRPGHLGASAAMASAVEGDSPPTLLLVFFFFFITSNLVATRRDETSWSGGSKSRQSQPRDEDRVNGSEGAEAVGCYPHCMLIC